MGQFMGIAYVEVKVSDQKCYLKKATYAAIVFENINLVCKVLGICPSTLRKRVKKLAHAIVKVAKQASEPYIMVKLSLTNAQMTYLKKMDQD